MNTFDEVKDTKLKTHFTFENEEEDENEKIGEKPEDFEIIKKLGEGAYGKVFKVISKLNNKVYAMKVSDLDKIFVEKSERDKELALNESKYLTALSHPHIIKYYTSFQIKNKNNPNSDGLLYLIIENAENGDLESFVEANKELGRHIPEDELWNIFLQCMQGLAYIHSMNVIHRDIKLGNILMDNNMTIKLGDFGTCAVKNNEEKENKKLQYLKASYGYLFEIEEMKCHGTVVGTEEYQAYEIEHSIEEYDQKIDVYSMGVAFYYMCYYCFPDEDNKKEKNNIGYSKEMLNIINQMLQLDPKKRQSSKEVLEQIQKEFSKRYNRNTSIDAVVRCLHSFKDLTKEYSKLTINNGTKNDEIKNKPITNAYVQCLKYITEKENSKYFESIRYFREILCTENTRFNKTNEINPKLVLAFLLRQLHQEMNTGKNKQDNINSHHYITDGLEEGLTNEIEMLLNFENKFLTNLNSFISKKLVGLLEKFYICTNCQIQTYSFTGYFFIAVNLEIEDFLNYGNSSWKITEKFCPKCLMKTRHNEFSKYYTAPDYLIVLFNRGSNDSNRNAVKIKQKIDLINSTVISGKNYNLVGFITKNYENEKYVSYCENDKIWYKCEDTKVNEINQEELNQILSDRNGEIMMVFYEAIQQELINY